MKLKFKSLKFSKQETKIKVIFQNIYYFYINNKDLEKIGKFKIDFDSITIKSSKKNENVEQKFNFLLGKGFENLKCSLNGKPVLYIHKNSGIPLLGSNEFGIVDRGTNMIEVKPLSTCNIDCIFCSVDHTKRPRDIVVEADYLVEELNKLVKIKENRVNIHIGSQGDTSIYGDLIPLVRKIKKIKKVASIAIVTNGIIITPTFAKKLIDAGISHFSISLHSLDQKKADLLANAKYPVKKVMKTCKFIAKNANLILVPVYVPTINDKDIEEIILFAKENGAKMGIQNFLEYKLGKKPVNPSSMKLFYKKLKDWEQKYDINLTTLDSDLEFKLDTKLPKPFRKGEIIEVELKAPSRLKNSMIAVAKDRSINVINSLKNQGKIKVKLIRDKDNIFTAVPA